MIQFSVAKGTRVCYISKAEDCLQVRVWEDNLPKDMLFYAEDVVVDPAKEYAADTLTAHLAGRDFYGFRMKPNKYSIDVVLVKQTEVK